MADEVAITNALVADLSGLALPAHTVTKYVEPRALRADKGNWLSVYPVGIDEDLVTTQSDYENFHIFEVVWAEPVFKQAESNLGEEPAAITALGTSKLIADRLRTYGGGVPGLFNITATLRKVRYGTGEQGFLWQAINTLHVEAFA